MPVFMNRVAASAFLFLGLVFGSNVPPPAAGDTVVAECLVQLNGTALDWNEIGRFVMPGETLWLDILESRNHSGWVASAGELVEISGRTAWVAPSDPGLYPLIASVGETMKRINAFVMVPAERVTSGSLNGFSIGKYQRTPPFPRFDKPRGFIEVTAENAATPVSARYTLRDFEPKNTSSYPKYMVLREDLLVKLELLTDLVKGKGCGCERLAILSGYRTPAGHRSGVSSAHYYGGAADVYIDADNDGEMDDLNHDGQSTSADARILAGWVDELEQVHPELVGGCGWYRRTRSRGPFVHTDVRGEPMRWHR
ncbi:MAG: hypothetical protein ABIL25_07065 [candidate division WOR-3 bacterium]